MSPIAIACYSRALKLRANTGDLQEFALRRLLEPARKRVEGHIKIVGEVKE
jgi:hypothetical protein